MKKVANFILGVVSFLLVTGISQAQTTNIEWKPVGPDNISGRSRTVLVDNRNSSQIYAGSAGAGLWYSKNGGTTWYKTNLQATCVNSLIQLPDGTIFIGTGEGLCAPFAPQVKAAFGIMKYGYSTSSYGIKGEGIYKMENDSTFVLLEATEDWKEINRMAYDSKTNTLYAATDDGLQYSTDNGESWQQAKAGNTALNLTGIDVKAENGVVVFADLDRGNRQSKAYISTSGPNGFTTLCGTNKISESAYRIELALAPSDSNYIYASAVNTDGTLINMYLSKDQGKTFSVILPGGSTTIDLYNKSGFNTNSLAVYPQNAKHILIGGYPYMWEGEEISENSYYSFNEIISANGIHDIVFDSTTIYFATNTGIAKSESLDEAIVSYRNLTKNLATAQITTMGIGHNGSIMAGSVDNGNLYISTTGNTTQTAQQLSSGYAGVGILSSINTYALYYTSTYGQCFRKASTTTDAETAGTWYDQDNEMSSSYGSSKYPSWSNIIMKYVMGSSAKGHATPSPIILWETTNDPYATEEVTFTADKRYDIGDSICVKSNTANYPMWMLSPKNMDTDDPDRDKSCKVIDRVQSRFFVGGSGFFTSKHVYGAPIYMTKGALNFTRTPSWFRIFFTTDTNEQVTNLCISEDGNQLYASTYSSATGFHNIYRISGFNTARDSATLNYGTSIGSRIDKNPSYALDVAKIYSTNLDFITSIYINPYDDSNNELIITFSSGEIQMASNAAEADDSTVAINLISKNGSGLPFDAAIYTALVLKSDDNSQNATSADMAMVGTEEGLYYTENFTSTDPTWKLAITGIDSKIPVTKLIQQRNNLEDAKSIYYSKSYINDSAVITETTVDFAGTYNHGWIYAATYGRGIFCTDMFGEKGWSTPDYGKTVKANTLHIYPNPTNNQAVIEYDLENETDVTIALYDANGRLVSSKNIGKRYSGSNQAVINCSNLTRGVYFVQIKTNNQNMNGKIVVTK